MKLVERVRARAPAASEKSCLNSANTASPVPVTLLLHMALPFPSVALQSSVMVKLVGGQVNALEDLDVVVIVGVKMKSMCLPSRSALSFGEDSDTTVA